MDSACLPSLRPIFVVLSSRVPTLYQKSPKSCGGESALLNSEKHELQSRKTGGANNKAVTLPKKAFLEAEMLKYEGPVKVKDEVIVEYGEEDGEKDQMV